MFFAKEILHQLLNAQKPSEFLIFMKSEGLIGRIPELNSLIGCIQEPEWHPEGDVWTHTMLVIDVAAELRDNFTESDAKEAFMLGSLCHDFGKPYTNNYDRGKIRSIMHDQYGYLPTLTFLKRCDINAEITQKVLIYVATHLIPMQFYKNKEKISDAAIRRLNDKIHIPDLIWLTKADHWGRTDSDSRNRKCESADWLLDKYYSIIKRK